MGTPLSPSRMFNGLSDETYNEAKFAHEISDKMRVPKRIKATGEYSDDDFLLSHNYGNINSGHYNDKIDMNVPDRIVVLGQNQHLGTRSAPLEIQLENSLFPKAPQDGFIRVQTPPRVITLNDHNFPSASASDTSGQNSSSKLRSPQYDNDDDDDYYHDDMLPPSYIVAQQTNMTGFNPNTDALSSESESQGTSGAGVNDKGSQAHNQLQQQQQHAINQDMSMMSNRDVGELTPHEEMLYLRRHLAKLNRRVLNIEINNEQRAQRDKIVYCLGLAYFVLKALVWLNKN